LCQDGGRHGSAAAGGHVLLSDRRNFLVPLFVAFMGLTSSGCSLPECASVRPSLRYPAALGREPDHRQAAPGRVKWPNSPSADLFLL
jgi:hypothetical protein